VHHVYHWRLTAAAGAADGVRVTVGRDTSNDVVLADPALARQQLALTRQGVGWHATNLSSTAPLYVNGRQQGAADLRPGDQLVIGTTILRFEASLPPRQTLAAEAAPYLVVGSSGSDFAAPLRDPTISLGRATDCGIVVPSPIVSLHRAVLLRVNDGSYAIEDAQSRNGLRFAHKPICGAQTLRDGDTVTIGEQSGVEVVTLTYVASRDLAATFSEPDPTGMGTLIFGERGLPLDDLG
jgi:pSer/pThr/pTyr-binding forkhead associated (FHA) protein